MVYYQLEKLRKEKIDGCYFTDGQNVFFSGLYEDYKIRGADLKTFKSAFYFAKDDSFCYVLGQKKKNSSPETFKVLNYSFAIDSNQAYSSTGHFKVDVPTFSVLDSGISDYHSPFGYAKDKNYVYFHNGDWKAKVLKSADVPSFYSLDNAMFARDCRSIFAYGKKLPGVDINTWEPISHSYSKDKSKIYYINRQIKEVDYNSFTILSTRKTDSRILAKDKNNFYHNDSIVSETEFKELLVWNEKYAKFENSKSS